MATESTTSKPIHKACGTTYIKNYYVPLLLDLKSHNYETWSDLFRAHCLAYDVLDHIDDSYDTPNKPPTNSEWAKLDAMVNLWIYGSITQPLITSTYSNQATARQVWLNLYSAFYEDKESAAMQLETELRNITLGDLSIHDYCDKIKKLCDHLESLGEKVKDRNIVYHTLNGLPNTYDGISNVIGTKPLPSLSEVRMA